MRFRDLRILPLLLLVVLSLGGPSLAGVVEDAEEALQTVPSDNPNGQRALDGSGAAVSSAPGSVGSERFDGASGGVNSGSRNLSSTTSGAGGGPSAGGGAAPAAEATPDAAAREAESRRKARDRSDTAVSLIGALVLLALVAAAGLYSKRAGRDD